MIVQVIRQNEDGSVSNYGAYRIPKEIDESEDIAHPYSDAIDELFSRWIDEEESKGDVSFEDFMEDNGWESADTRLHFVKTF